jgi:hypothetical protein
MSSPCCFHYRRGGKRFATAFVARSRVEDNMLDRLPPVIANID